MQQNIKDLLQELESTRETYWNIPPETGRYLNKLIKDRKYKHILEIGTSNGYSAIWIAEALMHNNGTLYTIESHKKLRFNLAKENIARSGLTNIIQILGHAPEDIPLTPKYFDMAFFDATKKEHLNFFKTIENRINLNGMIITDNILSHQEVLTPYIEHLKSLPSWKSQIYPLGTGIMVSEKIAN
ncbi:hypothetical protein CVV38_00895 [Candidatus Peregrinibacteria bacterium HGW-Peregrinibacteria-1]|jgi:predicted O-methyltransferase YrrM|nr:MAG: hypothetical protein CVV38_00895 [Candidatus Peregrinibacteria bacterium HGW-Peregrinibacteria-1]